MSVNEKLTAIADNIRQKTKNTEPLNLDSMAEEVTSVYEAGQAYNNSLFWKMYTNQNNRSNYDYAFAYATGGNYSAAIPLSILPPTDGTVKIKPTSSKYMFRNGRWFKKITADLFNFSSITGGNGTYTFYEASEITEIEDVGLGTGAITSLQYAFYGTYELTKIAKIKTNENVLWDGAFDNSKKLSYIRFDGVVGKSIQFKHSPLSVDSMKNIITCLKDLSLDGSSSRTVTFLSSAFNALVEEGETAEYNGEACTWEELIGFKNWNLVLMK